MAGEMVDRGRTADSSIFPNTIYTENVVQSERITSTT